MLSSFISTAEYNYELIDLIVKGAALFLGIISATYGYLAIRDSRKVYRYNYLLEFNKSFLEKKFLIDRTKVIEFWLDSEFIKFGANKNSNNFDISCISKIKNMEKMREKLKNIIDLNIYDIDYQFVEKNNVMISETEKVLNNYENVGKMWKLKGIEEEDISGFFYTTIADTFVACLPYIIYRRKSKENYACGIQELIKIAPIISGDIRRL